MRRVAPRNEFLQSHIASRLSSGHVFQVNYSRNTHTHTGCKDPGAKIHPSISIIACPAQGRGWLESIPADIGLERRGFGLDESGLIYRDKQSHTLAFTPMGNLDSPGHLTFTSMGRGRKLDWPEGTRAAHRATNAN